MYLKVSIIPGAVLQGSHCQGKWDQVRDKGQLSAYLASLEKHSKAVIDLNQQKLHYSLTECVID